MTFKIVYTDNVPGDFGIEREIFQDHDVEFVNGEASNQPIENLVVNADGVISGRQTFKRDLIDRMVDCKVISRRGIGVDYVDLDAASDNGMVVANVPKYCITDVSNHALTLLFALQRRIVDQNTAVRNGEWNSDAEPIHRLNGQVLGLVAFGNIARSFAEKANALGMDVIAHDPYLDEELVQDHGVSPMSFEKLLERSDVLSLHAPLTEETKGMIGVDEFEAMKNSAYLINTARGGLIDQDAAVEALESRKIAGAGLDVLEEEPPAPDDPILNQDNAIITPHMGHYSIESRRELRRKVAENILAIIEGRIPENIVNKNVLSEGIR